MLRPRSWFAGIVVLALCVGTTRAEQIQRLVVFGDSLSDTGNAFALTGDQYPPLSLGYAGGRFSNGPVWVEGLASKLGIPLANHAHGGAEANGSMTASPFSPSNPGSPLLDYSTSPPTFLVPVPALASQVSRFRGTGTPGAGDLAVILAGSNDLYNITDPASASAVVASAVGAVASAVASLHDAGVQNFLVGKLPRVGSVPFFNGDPATAAALDALAVGFNAGLEAQLDSLRTGLGVNIKVLDLEAVLGAVRADPAAYGFENATDSALLTGGDPTKYLFWDTAHPTAKGHEVIAAAAVQALGVPEPSTLVLMALATPGLLVWRRVRGRAADLASAS